MPVREKGVRTAILKVLNSTPCCYAVGFPGTEMRRGQPDLFVCYRGQLFVLEVKAPGAKGATKLQKENIKKWQAAGATALVVRSVDDALHALHVRGAPPTRGGTQAFQRAYEPPPI